MPSRTRSALRRVPGHQRPDPVHQQPHRRLQHRRDRPTARRSKRTSLGLAGGRRQAAPRAAVEGRWRRQPGAGLRHTASKSTTAARKPSTRARCPKKAGKDSGSEQHGVPALGEDRNEDRRSRRARRTERRDPLRRRRPADLHPPRRAQARRRSARRCRGRLGRQQRHPAAGGDLLQLVELAGAPARRRPTSPSKPSPPRSSKSRRPPGAKVVDLSPQRRSRRQGRSRARRSAPKPCRRASASRWSRRARWPGCPQGEVRSIEVDGKTAALVTYGKGLGGIAVIESASEPGEEPAARTPKAASACRRSRSTALRAKSSTPRSAPSCASAAAASTTSSIGSVPPAAAEAAARAL